MKTVLGGVWQPPARLAGESQTAIKTRMELAGTDTRGFPLPPDVSRAYKKPPGTDERSFCCPPDLVARRFLIKQVHEAGLTLVGTDLLDL